MNTSSFSNRFPNDLKTQHANLDSLTPNIHWARKIKVNSFNNSRRIYDLEFFYVVQGKFEVQILDENYSVSSGQLVYLPAGVYHRMKLLTNQEAIIIGIHFDCFDEFVTNGIHDSIKDDEIIVNEKAVKHHHFCKEPLFSETGRFLKSKVLTPLPKTVLLMEALVQEFTVREFGYHLVCKNILLQIITHLLRLEIHVKKKTFRKYEQQILSLAHLLETQFSDHWTTAKMAAKINLQEDYMGRLFKQITGMPPHNYLQNIRLHEAKRLLCETDLTIDSIASKVGYDDLHYFSRLFRKHAGLPPGEYRKMYLIF